MATDLTKMVNSWFKKTRKERQIGSDLYYLLLNIADEIKANRKEIEKLKIRHGERIDPKGVNQ